MVENNTYKEYDTITELINQIAEEVNSVLNDDQEEKYFEEVILLYSFIENLLKWLVFMELLWIKAEKREEEPSQEELNKQLSFFENIQLYDTSCIALFIGLIDINLCKQIDEIRNDRNKFVHQLWIHCHRNDTLVLREKLEKLSRVANKLVEIFNQLTNKVGVDEVYEFFLKGKN